MTYRERKKQKREKREKRKKETLKLSSLLFGIFTRATSS
jgi:hypothetical protein